MEEEGPYEILPYKEIMQLKRDIEDLKRSAKDVTSQDLLNSMNGLSKNMADLMELFKAASMELKDESRKEEESASKIKIMYDKLNEITEENKIIANGILAVSNNLENKFKELSERISRIEGGPKEIKSTFKRTKFEEPKPTYANMPQKEGPLRPDFGSFPDIPPELHKPRFTPPPPPPFQPQRPTTQYNPPPMPPPGMTDNFDNLFPEEPKKKGIFGRLFKK